MALDCILAVDSNTVTQEKCPETECEPLKFVGIFGRKGRILLNLALITLNASSRLLSHSRHRDSFRTRKI